MQILGLFFKTVFKDEKTGYSGFFLRGENDTIFCKGTIFSAHYNIPLKLEGEFKKDKIGRDYFAFAQYTLFAENEEYQIQMLNCLNISGMGLQTCVEIVNIFKGQLIFYALNQNKQDFNAHLPRKYHIFGTQIYRKIKRIYRDEAVFRAIIQAGGSYQNTISVLTAQGSRALEMLTKDPYTVGLQAHLTFSTCDRLFFTLNNIDPHRFVTSLRRQRGLLYFAIDASMACGNSYATLDELFLMCKKLEREGVYQGESFISIIAQAILDDSIAIDEDKFYYKLVKNVQDNLIRNILRISRSAKELPFDDTRIADVERELDIKYSASQLNAFYMLKSTGIKILTGGPGTGKTTVTNGLIKYCEMFYPQCKVIRLCAPTGCAAQNLAEKTGHPAETIHKMLNIRPYAEFENLNELEADVIIVDEVSMMDLDITYRLMRAAQNGSLIILIGDKNQLPSVRAGNILQDLIDSEILEHYELTEIFRQSFQSLIVKNAYNVLNGNTDLETDGEQFSVLTVKDEEGVLTLCDNFMLDDWDGKQMLAPMKRSLAGTINLNRLVQNMHKENEPFKLYGGHRYYRDSRIIMVVNNYEAGYYNGDIGYVNDFDEDGIEVRFIDNRRVFIPNANMMELMPAYALTVHKSQGNEYNNVVIVLNKKGYRMMTRNLLYTAVTRAKKTVTIIEESGMLHQAIVNVPKKRNSDLAFLLRKSYMSSAEVSEICHINCKESLLHDAGIIL